MEDRCVMCGEIIPEGRMVCPVCEERVLNRKGEQTMKARTIRETEYTWEQIEEILAAGKARETFGEDGQITVQVEGIGTALLNILDYDKDKAQIFRSMKCRSMKTAVTNGRSPAFAET